MEYNENNNDINYPPPSGVGSHGAPPSGSGNGWIAPKGPNTGMDTTGFQPYPSYTQPPAPRIQPLSSSTKVRPGIILPFLFLVIKGV